MWSTNRNGRIVLDCHRRNCLICSKSDVMLNTSDRKPSFHVAYRLTMNCTHICVSSQIIAMDTDVIINHDIAELWSHFYHFNDKQVIHVLCWVIFLSQFSVNLHTCPPVNQQWNTSVHLSIDHWRAVQCSYSNSATYYCPLVLMHNQASVKFYTFFLLAIVQWKIGRAYAVQHKV